MRPETRPGGSYAGQATAPDPPHRPRLPATRASTGADRSRPGSVTSLAGPPDASRPAGNVYPITAGQVAS
jgi:hypothetical protein